MSEQTHIQLRKRLDVSLPAPVWPEGIALAPFYSVDPRKIHALLDEAFPGLVARFEDWYGNLKSLAEFDPALSVTALTTDGSVAGYAQCWKHGFVKDLAVAPSHQGKAWAKR